MIQKLLLIASTILIFFILLTVFLRLIGPIPLTINSINTNKTDSFSVTGEGKSTIKPDLATVTVGVTAQAATSKDVQENINLLINKVTGAIKALGIEAKDIQTQNYNINPNYDYANGSQTLKGYNANTNIIVKVKKITDADKVLDAATQNGATQVGGINFDNSDKTQAENEARTKAVDQAKMKAKQAAKIAGFKLGKIINYQENFDGDIRPIGAFALSKAAGGVADSTQVEPGTNEVSIAVTLSYEVK